MIVLIDNEEYMIKLCEDSEDIHGFSTSFPGWKGYVKLISDIGMMAVVSGKEAEDYLDENHIYYIHIEDEGETYKEFLIKLMDAIEDNSDFIESNKSYGKLVYAITEDLEEGTTDTENVLEIWRYNEDDKYYLDLTLIGELRDMPSYVLKSVCDTLLDKTVKDLAPTMDINKLAEGIRKIERPIACNDDFDYLFSADTLKEMLIKLAILLKSIYNGEYIDSTDEE